MKTDRHLIPLVPGTADNGPCPACGSASVETVRTVFPGIHVMGEYRCASCQVTYYRDLPYGFAVDHPVTIGTDGTLFNGDALPEWIRTPFMKGFSDRNEGEVRIERRVFKESRQVVVLNTLDFLYGHVLLKLYNAAHYLDKHPDLGLVVVLPRMYEWLIPKGCAEAWIVDLGLGRSQGWHTAIDTFVQQRLKEHDEVYLAKGYSHPDITGMDIARFTGVQAFDPATFGSAPPHVTFVTREDRLWFRNGVTKFLHRACNRLGLRALSAPLVILDQDRLVKAAMRRLRRALPGITFSIVGLGDARMHARGVEDLRTRTMNVDTERAWCRAYGRSQVVVGVHGSNMLLPTAHAGACIEILPHQRYGNIVQDISVRYEGRAQLFHYRFVDEFASPADITRHIRSIFTDRTVFMRNNHVNVF